MGAKCRNKNKRKWERHNRKSERFSRKERQNQIRETDPKWATIEDAFIGFISAHMLKLNPSSWRTKLKPLHIGYVTDDSRRLIVDIRYENRKKVPVEEKDLLRVAFRGFDTSTRQQAHHLAEVTVDVKDPESFDKVAQVMDVANDIFWLGVDCRHWQGSALETFNNALGPDMLPSQYVSREGESPEYLKYWNFKADVRCGVFKWRTPAGSIIYRCEWRTLFGAVDKMNSMVNKLRFTRKEMKRLERQRIHRRVRKVPRRKHPGTWDQD